VLLVTSGWRIYNATRFLDFAIPRGITLGGWLGGALQWHFAAMWLLVFNGILYSLINLFSAAGCGASFCRCRRARCCTTWAPR
jgi:thiosulfate reductase cytochrome b subunit